ncbi:MAG: Wzt carbohydrate-binding domain-containing protein [Candidatus Solibacter usitatus]|nr:Wzt carbohydrate-binding domain-containing protein [Candidatus Solibacter usitatus]
MVEKDAAYLTHKKPAERTGTASVRAPEIADRIPNIDHRHGDGRAEVIGIAVLDPEGRPLHVLEPQSRMVVRISVRAKQEIPLPIVGFMMRNHLGLDFSGANTSREGFEMPPMQPGDICTVDFHLELPELYPGAFSFSPAIADGTLLGYTMCDWIDNAIALQMGPSDGQIYGFLHLPCRVELNARLIQEERKIG